MGGWEGWKVPFFCVTSIPPCSFFEDMMEMLCFGYSFDRIQDVFESEAKLSLENRKFE